MTPEEHKQRHEKLHRALDELLADWLEHGGGMETDRLGNFGTKRSIADLCEWSYKQTQGPDHSPERDTFSNG